MVERKLVEKNSKKLPFELMCFTGEKVIHSETI